MVKGNLKTQVEVLSRIFEEKGLGSKLSYAIGRNIGLIEKELKVIQKVISPRSQYREFMEEYKQLCRSYAVKDENGKPIIKELPNGSEELDIDPDTREEFDGKLEELKEKYKDAIDDQVEREKVLEEELPEDFYYNIKMRHVPDDHPALVPKIMYWLQDIIIDEDADDSLTEAET